MKYQHIVQYVSETPWALLPARLATILELVAFRAAGGVLSEEEIRQRIGAATKAQSRQVGAVAVVPVRGVIVNRAGMMSDISGGTSIERLRSEFQQAMNDSAVSCVLLSIDSPGGSTDGVKEMADEIYEARATKPVYAIADTMAASAAYWLGSAASEFYASPSALVGSIGVYAAHQDISKAMEQEGVKMTLISAGARKTEGNPYQPLSEEAQAHIQGIVDSYHDMFLDAVARGRNTSIEDVRENYGQGRVLTPKDAKKAKMIDGIATMDQLMARLMRQTGQRQGARAEGEIITIEQAAEAFDVPVAMVEDARRRRLRLAARR